MPIFVCSSSEKKDKPKAGGWAWTLQRKNALAVFGQFTDLDIAKLWQMSCPEEPYVKYVMPQLESGASPKHGPD